MGVASGKSFHARHRHGTNCQHDRRQAQALVARRHRWWIAGNLTFASVLVFFLPAQYLFAQTPDTVRIATYTVELTRKGPGLLLRDILSEDDAQIIAAQSVIAENDPDILLLVGFDYDLHLIALSAFADQLEQLGAPYPHRFARRPNSGRPSGLDLDGDGRLGGARDAQGYGRFSGHGGMAILSRYPITETGIQDFTDLLWQELPGAHLADLEAEVEAGRTQRLSSINHWAVPVKIDGLGLVELLTIGATPPVFDGPEDRIGYRNRDELRLWHLYLNGGLDQQPHAPVVLLGKFNVDPFDGDGRSEGIAGLLSDPHLQDPQPSSEGAREAADQTHQGPSALDTAAFDPAPEGPGNLRVDYVLPDAKLTVAGAGVVWPPSGDPRAADIERAARHRLVWVDLVRDR